MKKDNNAWEVIVQRFRDLEQMEIEQPNRNPAEVKKFNEIEQNIDTKVLGDEEEERDVGNVVVLGYD